MKAMPVNPVSRKPFQPLTGSEALRRQLAYKKEESLKSQIQGVRQQTELERQAKLAERQARLEAQSRAEEMMEIAMKLADENTTPEEKELLKERLQVYVAASKK